MAQRLEEQFGEYGLLTEKQKNKLRKKVLREYHQNKRKYNAEDIEDLFEGTNIPQEIISKEISTIVKDDRYFPEKNSKKYKQYKSPRRNIKEKIKQLTNEKIERLLTEDPNILSIKRHLWDSSTEYFNRFIDSYFCPNCNPIHPKVRQVKVIKADSIKDYDLFIYCKKCGFIKEIQ